MSSSRFSHSLPLRSGMQAAEKQQLSESILTRDQQPLGSEEKGSEEKPEEVSPEAVKDSVPLTKPFSVFTRKEKWLIVAMIGLAGLFR